MSLVPTVEVSHSARRRHLNLRVNCTWMEVIAGARLAFRSETVPTLPHRNSDLKQRAHMFAIIRARRVIILRAIVGI